MTDIIKAVKKHISLEPVTPVGVSSIQLTSLDMLRRRSIRRLTTLTKSLKFKSTSHLKTRRMISSY